MASSPFDVNDRALREAFLREGLLGSLAALRADSPATWGRMTAQQVVEHLAWTFEVSTGRVRVGCAVPEERRARIKEFLHRNTPTPHDFMNPELVAGLPPLRHGDLTAARVALRAEVDRFLDQARAVPDAVHTHPVFGPLGMEEWSRAHYKHGHHHLLQFGLIDG